MALVEDKLAKQIQGNDIFRWYVHDDPLAFIINQLHQTFVISLRIDMVNWINDEIGGLEIMLRCCIEPIAVILDIPSQWIIFIGISN